MSSGQRGFSNGKRPTMARRQHLTLTLIAVMVFFCLTYLMSSSRSNDVHSSMTLPHDDFSQSGSRSSSSSSSNNDNPALGVSDRILKGGSIAPKLENATAK